MDSVVSPPQPLSDWRSEPLWESFLPWLLRALDGEYDPPANPQAALGRARRQIEQRGGWLPAAPDAPPLSAGQVAAGLFPQYGVENGQMRLSGCLLEDHPLLRFSFLRNADGDNDSPRVVHHYTAVDGRELPAAWLQGLKLDRLQAGSPQRFPRLDAADAHGWLENGRRSLAHNQADELLLAAIVWCKYAEGKLLFEIGEQQIKLPFRGWARLLADGVLAAPFYDCRLSDTRSRKLAVDDRGRIVAAEALAECQESQRRVLQTELQTCSVSGRRALSEFFTPCPILHEDLLERLLVECSLCGERVSPLAIRQSECLACLSLTAVPMSHPRVGELLEHCPALRKWGRWKLAETRTAAIFTAAYWTRQLLLVVERETWSVRKLAQGWRFSSHWSPVSVLQWDAYLRESPSES